METVALSLPETGSPVGELTLMVLTMGSGPAYEGGTRKVAVIVRAAPAGTVPSAQGNAVVQSPLVETNVNPVGVGSVTATVAASLGPLFVTVMV